MYKLGMAIPENMVNSALFYCYSDELWADILRDIREDLSTKSEDELLTAIKRLAVKERGILAQRLELGKMTQTPGTGIRSFLAGLRRQAALCQYTAKCKVGGCTHTYDFSDEIIKDNLVHGMADQEIMSDPLRD